MADKTCKNCLHFKVCKIIASATESVDRRGPIIEPQSFMQQLANHCDEYLVYDKSSPEAFMENVRSAHRKLVWMLNMQIDERRTEAPTHELWLKETFVPIMKTGKECLDDIIEMHGDITEGN